MTDTKTITIRFTGKPGSGTTSLASLLARYLYTLGMPSALSEEPTVLTVDVAPHNLAFLHALGAMDASIDSVPMPGGKATTDEQWEANVTGFDRFEARLRRKGAEIARKPARITDKEMAASIRGADRITIGSRSYQRILLPEDTQAADYEDDGTSRCIACGQIDDEPYHDAEVCRKARMAGMGVNARANASYLASLKASDAAAGVRPTEGYPDEAPDDAEHNQATALVAKASLPRNHSTALQPATDEQPRLARATALAFARPKRKPKGKH